MDKADTTTSNVPRDVLNIIVDIKVIAGIPANKKLNTMSKTYGEADSVYYGIRRWWEGETRTGTIEFINNTIDRAIDVCVNNKEWTDMVADEIGALENALNNLIQTYVRTHDSKMENILKTIKLRIDRDRFLRACS